MRKKPNTNFPTILSHMIADIVQEATPGVRDHVNTQVYNEVAWTVDEARHNLTSRKTLGL